MILSEQVAQLQSNHIQLRYWVRVLLDALEATASPASDTAEVKETVIKLLKEGDEIDSQSR